MKKIILSIFLFSFSNFLLAQDTNDEKTYIKDIVDGKEVLSIVKKHSKKNISKSNGCETNEEITLEKFEDIEKNGKKIQVPKFKTDIVTICN